MALAPRQHCEAPVFTVRCKSRLETRSLSRGDRMQMRARRNASLLLFVAAFAFAAAGRVNAQSSFAPYYGKNLIHYDKFDWHIYKTDHFEIYYYPENEQHL